jgi:hypothetical protein
MGHVLWTVPESVAKKAHVSFTSTRAERLPVPTLRFVATARLYYF